MSSGPRYVVKRDWQGPYVISREGWLICRTLTERGAIRKAKRMNREWEFMNQPPVRVWPKEDES